VQQTYFSDSVAKQPVDLLWFRGIVLETPKRNLLTATKISLTDGFHYSRHAIFNTSHDIVRVLFYSSGLDIFVVT